jgi:hypothetical protein
MNKADGEQQQAAKHEDADAGETRGSRHLAASL